jgi:hypothetical protein
MSADEPQGTTPKPIAPTRLAEELRRLSAMRKNGELDATGFDQRFARMVGELRDRRIDGGREEIEKALAPLRNEGLLRPEEWFRLEKQLGLS